jgi:SAM-dependent methyltransferase
MTAQSDKVFGGSIAEVYHSHLVPLLFESYAKDLAHRLASRPFSRVLEVAAGTGVVTRKLASALPAGTAIVASDLNQAMLDVAAAAGTARPVEWRQADAMQLPFPDGGFDAVVCQFGAMFFPDKPRAFAEARRVLRPGGKLVFSVWDRIEENEFADRPAAFPAAHAVRLLAARDHRGGPGPRRIHRATPDHHGRGAEPGRGAPHPRDRILPGLSPAQRDRGARPRRPRGSHRPGDGRDHAALRGGRRGRPDPGARHYDRGVNSPGASGRTAGQPQPHPEGRKRALLQQRRLTPPSDQASW